MEQSDWSTLGAWRATSRACFASVAICLKRRYRNHVQPFVGDIDLFDSALIRHGAIVSGSVALHFFLPDSSWYPNDLDVYVSDAEWLPLVTELTDPNGLRFLRYVPPSDASKSGPVQSHLTNDSPSTSTSASADPLASELSGPVAADLSDVHTAANHDLTSVQSGDDDVSMASEDGSDYGSDGPTPIPLSSAYVVKGLRDVRKFVTPTGKHVDVIRSPTYSPVTPLRFFWSTLVMNFITPRACVCGFPSATMQRIGVLKQGLLRPRDHVAIAKYRDERGFYFVGDQWRKALDMWDHLFFGERDLIAIDYRVSPSDEVPTLPIRYTVRGWVPNTSAAPRRGECILDIYSHLSTPDSLSCTGY